MLAGEKLMREKKGASSEPSPAGEYILKILGNPFVSFTLDWGPLILFYALMGCTRFAYASLWSAVAGCGTILCTYVRSFLDPRVMNLKVLDVGFFLTFLIFAVVSFSSELLENLLVSWCNPVIDLSLTLIVVVGNLSGRPFILAYAREEVPASVWEDPYIQKNIIKACTAQAWKWAYIFLAMTLATLVPSVAQLARHGRPSPALKLWFNNVAQYTILALGLFRFTVWERWKREERQARLQATAGDLQGEYGPPLAPSAVPCAAHCPRGTTIASITSKEFGAAATVLRKALCDDPLFTTWPGIGDLPTAEREAAIERALSFHLRQMERWGHVFGVYEQESGSPALRAAICCVPAWRGDETALAWSHDSFAMCGWDLPAPSEEYASLEEARSSYLNGKPHLFVWLYGGDPEGHGKGFGRAALHHAFSIADARGVPIVLETCTLSNRAHYEHKGFKCVFECAMPGCTEPWSVMVRDPQPKILGYGSMGDAAYEDAAIQVV